MVTVDVVVAVADEKDDNPQDFQVQVINIVKPFAFVTKHGISITSIFIFTLAYVTDSSVDHTQTTHGTRRKRRRRRRTRHIVDLSRKSRRDNRRKT